MRWPVALIVGWVLLALEPVVREALRLGNPSASPSLVVPLVVFVALFAPGVTAYWTALILGFLVDVTTLRGGLSTGGVPPMVIVGPHAIGFVAGAFLVHTVRPMMMKKNPLTIMALSMVVAGLVAVVASSILGMRELFLVGSWGDGGEYRALSDLAARLVGALYTAGTGLVIGAILLWLHPLFSFHDSGGRRAFSRRS